MVPRGGATMNHCPSAGARWRSVLLLAVLAGWAGLARAGEAELTVSSELLRQAPAAREKAIQARLAATPVTWPASRRTLNEAVAALAATGNPTVLATGVDANLAA